MIGNFLMIWTYLRKDPSITAPVTSDSIYGVKHKAQKNADDDQDEEEPEKVTN